MLRPAAFLSLVLALPLTASAQAPPSPQPAPPPPHTKVTLTELHCMGCARKIAKKVTAVPGVAEMRVDLKAKVVFIMHKPGATPSPLRVWEAIEKADHTPTRLETPTGAHTAKPKS